MNLVMEICNNRESMLLRSMTREQGAERYAES